MEDISEVRSGGWKDGLYPFEKVCSESSEKCVNRKVKKVLTNQPV
jgi:hypothetical protein